MNGGFGLVLDGSEAAGGRARSMLGWDVSNGVARSHNFYQKHHRYPHHQHSNHPHYDDHHPDHHHHVADVPGVATTMLKQQLGELWRINHCSGLSHISSSSSHLHPYPFLTFSQSWSKCLVGLMEDQLLPEYVAKSPQPDPHLPRKTFLILHPSLDPNACPFPMPILNSFLTLTHKICYSL